MELQELKIGRKTARVPIIQGGMGVGVSRFRLAGAVAKEGGVGMISSAQIGYDEPDFEADVQGCNARSIQKHVALAKQQADGGLVGVNIMVALQHYAEHVKAAVCAGADLIACGAGLPVDLPELVKDSDTAIAPIISTKKAASVILRMWDKKYKRTADLLVVEGPKAGGHLGFSHSALCDIPALSYDEEIKEIIREKRIYEQKYGVSIPVVVGGGIFDQSDIRHVMELGADGVQIASRFVATKECDASMAYKQAYVQAKEEDIAIINSPVGMPGRAIRNAFIRKAEQGQIPVTKCFHCIKKCNPKETAYCITQALVNAVKGNLDEGLIFCGANVGRITEITDVATLMRELATGF